MDFILLYVKDNSAGVCGLLFAIIVIIIIIVIVASNSGKKPPPKRVITSNQEPLYMPQEQIQKIYEPLPPPHEMEAEPEIEINKTSVRDFNEQVKKFKKLYDLNILTYTECSLQIDNLINQLSPDNIDESKEDFLLGLSPLLQEKILSEDNIKKIKSLILNQ